MGIWGFEVQVSSVHRLDARLTRLRSLIFLGGLGFRGSARALGVP